MKTIVLLFFFCSMLVQGVIAQADIRLYPSRLFFYQQEGLVQTKTIHLVNRSAKKIVCRAEILDWQRDSTGNKIYYRENSLPSSASRMMSVQHNTIVLEPEEDKEITIRMDMKNGEAGFKNSMLFFTQIDTDSLRKGLKILIQLGVHLYSLPQKYVEKQVKVNKAIFQNKDSTTSLSLDISNLTQGVVDTEIKADILSEDGNRLDESKKVPVSSMPGDSFKVTIPFIKSNKLQNARKIIVYIDNGFEHPLQVVEIPFKQ
jgi:hypothetical protein